MTPRNSRQVVARAETTTVDDPVARRVLRREFRAEPQLRTQALQPGDKVGKRPARVEMPLAGKKQALAEASFQIRLQRGDASSVDRLMALGHPGEAAQVRRIARRRDDETAIEHDAADTLRPPGNGIAAEPHHRLLGALALAPGGEHAARPPGAGGGTGRFRALVKRHLKPAFGKDRGNAKPDDATADDGDLHRKPSHSRWK